MEGPTYLTEEWNRSKDPNLDDDDDINILVLTHAM
jgi:hypothetical protein